MTPTISPVPLTRNQMRCLMEACGPGGTPASRWTEQTVKSLVRHKFIEQRFVGAISPAAPRGTRVSIYVTTPAGVERMQLPLKAKSNGYVSAAQLKDMLRQTRAALKAAQQWMPPHDGADAARAKIAEALATSARAVL